MKFDELNEDTYILFAIKHYENPHCVTSEDFDEDLKDLSTSNVYLNVTLEVVN